MKAPAKGSKLDGYWRKKLGVGTKDDHTGWDARRPKYVKQLAEGVETTVLALKSAQDKMAFDQKRAAAKLKAKVAAALAAKDQNQKGNHPRKQESHKNQKGNRPRSHQQKRPKSREGRS